MSLVTINCTIPTPEMRKMGEKLGLSTSMINNLWSLWHSIEGKSSNPTLNDITNLIKRNKQKVENYKYALPEYTIIETDDGSNKIPSIEVDEDGTIMLHIVENNDEYFKEFAETLKKNGYSHTNLIQANSDVYTLLLWRHRILEEDYDRLDDPNAPIHAWVDALSLLSDYKGGFHRRENEKEDNLPYKTSKNLKGRLAYTDSEGNITIKEDVTVEEFFNYITGKGNSQTSKQKQLVLEEMANQGVSLEDMKRILNSTAKIKQFLYLHELSHVLHHSEDTERYDREDISSPINVEIELRANMFAWESMNADFNTPVLAYTSGNTGQYGVVIDTNLKANSAKWQSDNPNGIVAYRVNFNKYNTSEEVQAGRIGNPFSETNRGEDTVQQFFTWLTTGKNFGESKATEEYRQAIINKILNSPKDTPILYYKELGRPSHATIIGYLIRHKDLLSSNADFDILSQTTTKFSTSSNNSYPSRTKENADWSDITLALAIDFTTAGEKLTKRVAGNKYVSSTLPEDNNDNRLPYNEEAAYDFYAKEIYEELKKRGKTSNIKLNIAGNGIYSLNGFTTQEELNTYVTNLLRSLQKLGVTISEIRSGGQTGVDEAGIIAAQRLGIPSEVHSTANFTFRDKSGKDISDEQMFKARFSISSSSRPVSSYSGDIKSSNIGWARTAENGYEVSTRGDKRFSALNATFAKGTIIDGVDVSGRTIEDVYQHVIKKSGKGQAPAYGSILNYDPAARSEDEDFVKTLPTELADAIMGNYTGDVYATKEQLEDYSYYRGYLPLWQEWARQNPQLMGELRIKAQGKTLTDQFANTRVNQARALSDILNNTNSSATTTSNTGELTVSSPKKEVSKPSTPLVIPTVPTDMVEVKESPRMAVARDLSPRIIQMRVGLIARSFSEVIDEEIADAIEGTQELLDNEIDPLKRLKLSEQLKTLKDPVKGRRHVIEELGLEGEDGILAKVKQRYQDWVDMSDEELADTVGADNVDHVRSHYSKLLEHFDVLFEDALSIIESREAVRIVRDTEKEENSTIEKSQAENESNEELLGDDENGNRVTGNEGYSFRVRFQEPSKTIRAETRRALSDLIDTTSDGETINDDLGNPMYVREDFAHTALLGILSKMTEPSDFCVRESDGSLSFPLLEKHVNTYPWIAQVINNLEYDENLISIFYTDFRKAFVNYWMLRGDKIFALNTPTEQESTMESLQKNYEQGRMVAGKDTIYNSTLGIDKRNVEKCLTLVTSTLDSMQTAEIEDIVRDVNNILNRLGFSSDNINSAILNTPEGFTIMDNVLRIAKVLLEDTLNLDKGQYYVDVNRNSLREIAKLIGKASSIEATTVFRQFGNTYPSYAAPNYIETMFMNLKNNEKFEKYIEEEFGKYSWFKYKGEWQSEWLRLISQDENIRDMMDIKNVFCIDNAEYEDWSPSMITELGLKEYFAIQEDSALADQYAWYNFPIFSDTKMSTFIKFKKYTGDFVGQMLPLYRKLVFQELRRIALVESRAKKGVPQISNFDKRGKGFCFLPELNTLRMDYNGEQLTLLDIIRKLSKSKDVKSINTYIDSAVLAVLDSLSDKFSKDHLDDIKNVSEYIMEKTNTSTNEEVHDKIREYVWNQVYATSQIIQLTTTDLAYYKNSTDFQKRYKEVYASGTRLNTNSKYGRQKERTVYIKDRITTSPSFIPLQTLFKKAVDEGNISKADYDSIMYKFKNINGTDAQAYRSLSSYRAVMDMLGSWSEEMEKSFKNLTEGTWDMSDFNTVWQTIKPFVYGQIPTPDGLGGLMRTPHQNKNSEFLLLATYQALGTALNSSPQLRGLNKFMEEHDIDVVQFESAVKTGGGGIININVSPSAIKEAENNKSISVNGTTYKIPSIKSLSIDDAFDKIKEHFDKLLEKGKINQKEYNSIIDYFTPTEQEVYDTLTKYTRSKNNKTDVLDDQGYNMTTVHSIDYKDYMIAQPNPEHIFDVEAVYGSQFRNLITSDLSEDAEITVNGKVIKGRDNIIREYQSLIVENLLEDYEKLSKEVMDIETLQKRLLSIVRGNPKYGRDILDALELVDYNGKKVFNLPLYDLTITERVQELTLSVFKNSITKQHIKGAACTLVSDFGFTDELQIVRNEDGSIKEIQCYMPAYSKKFYEPFLIEEKNSKGKVLGYKLDIEKIKAVDPSLLEAVGYRIPTEGKYSMVNLRIKGFLPQQNGSSIMLPAEITTMSGSDFDIDKLFIMLPEFKFSPVYNVKQAWDDFYNDNPEIVSKIEEAKSAEFKRVLNEFLSNNPEVDEEDIDLDALFNKVMKGHKNYEFVEGVQKEFSKWFKDKKSKYKLHDKLEKVQYDENKSIAENSRAARNNKIISIARQILSNRGIGLDSQSPGNFDNITSVGERLSIATDPDLLLKYYNKFGTLDVFKASIDEIEELLEEFNSSDNPLTLDNFIKYHQQNMSGSVLIGIYANNTTQQAKMQNKPLSIKDAYTFSVDGRKVKSLTNIYAEEVVDGKKVKKKISKNCAEFSASSVDNAKKPVLGLIMQNKETANIACFMLRAGFSIRQIGTMFNSPIVKECITKKGDITRLGYFIGEYERKIATIKQVSRVDIPISTTIDTNEIFKTIIDNTSSYISDISDSAKADLYTNMVKHAKQFLLIAKIAEDLNATVQVYRADSPNGAVGRNIALAQAQVTRLDKLLINARKPTFAIEGVEKIIRNRYISSEMSRDTLRDRIMQSETPMLQAFYSLGIEFALQAYKDSYIQLNPYVQEALSNILLNSPRELTLAELGNFYRGFILFGLSDTKLFGNTEEMTMEQMRSYYLNDFPKQFNLIVNDNPDIAELDFIQALTSNGKTIIARGINRKGALLSEMLMRSMDSLMYLENPKAQSLAVDLLRYAYFKEGLKFGPNNFSVLISSVFKANIPEYINTMRDMNSVVGTTSMWDRYLSQFYANYGIGITPLVNVQSENVFNEGNTISIPRKKVTNTNSISPIPWEYVRTEDSEGNLYLYKLDRSSIERDKVIYNRVKTVKGNIPVFNSSMDSDSMADEFNANYHEEDETEGDGEFYLSESGRPDDAFFAEFENDARDFSGLKGIDSMAKTKEFEVSDDFSSAFSSFEKSLNEADSSPEEEYSPEEGLEEVKETPCKKTNKLSKTEKENFDLGIDFPGNIENFL